MGQAALRLGDELIGERERLVPLAAPVELVHPLGLQPAESAHVPEALGGLRCQRVKLEGAPEVPERCVHRCEVVVAADQLG